MEDSIESRLERTPVIKQFIKLLKFIKLPALEGLTLYDFLRIYIKGIIKGTITSRASAIAFSFFTAIFPFLLFVIILIPYIPVKGFETEFRAFLNSVLPPQTSEFFFENIFQNIKGDTAGLISTVFVLSLFLMANGISALFSGFESSYHQQLTRSIVKQYLYSIGVALILTILLIVSIAVLGYFQLYVVKEIMQVFERQGYEMEKWAVFWSNVVKFVFFIVMIYLATATLYYFGTKEGKHSRFFSAGALLTTILIILFSYLFGIYITYFSTYNQLYGSIGALLIILFYLWLNSNLLLLGFELNATIRRLKRKNDNE
ncbi:YihY/virulence factor BrkB family protein [Subsaximicrobium wynnwilliamsii]|uniref:YihY/virulence factor BrkB family protein n=1 Tax=Subsaximicrobium wynnwilliamsii TaxID=291179 RepID=A0A5C6ZR03_9FLAO|nr:YihY/virulence factor BrkB family protein [Subsaximicrobium wynnwilliamsii]TXD91323.1 YihY/virulence factor BrkB family protein [Subsaximicrobium wynnwilliamsii]TXE01103.1 YihY/virulence factor BrkB family protein [Subsaximicrobium wynnwilliamsii]